MQEERRITVPKNKLDIPNSSKIRNNKNKPANSHRPKRKIEKNKIDVPDISNHKRTKKQKTNKSDRAVSNKSILMIAYIFAGLFLSLMFYVAKFVAVDSQEVITNSYNKRQDMFAESVIRGSIISSDNQILAKSIKQKGDTYTRSYPYNNIFAHVVGFDTKGKSGLEASYNYNLLTSNANIFERLYNDLTEQKNIGDNIISTIDSRLQKVAYDALGNHKGAVVAIEPSTGKILAMVSKPDFDPNQIDAIWDTITKEDSEGSSKLLNRATQGLYPPGSTYKMLTALEYMRENKDYGKYTYTCKGKDVFYGVEINCYNNKVHGKVDLAKSLAVSCNTSFANIGSQLNIGSLHKLSNNFLFNTDLPFRFNYSKSSFVLNSKSDKGEIAQTVIGQGKTLMTPLHSALVTATVANGGVMMKPYLVDRIENYDGVLVKKYSPKSYKQLMTGKEATTLTTMMKGVVDAGTASALSNLGHEVAGKTGSAEFEEGKAAHAWFTGFSPTDNPEIVISVVVENVGTGSTYAVPIAQKMFAAYYNNK